MTYNEALNYINSRRKFQKSSSHERIRALLQLLGNPQEQTDFVHVVGTNGKGTVCTCLSEILTCAGYTTGLFTSPFIVKFEERIRVNGKFISEEELCEITQLVKEKTLLIEQEDLHPTVFETILAIALVYYKRKGCSIVVLEAGIGGGKDSTNVIPPPLVSIFTSISLDHTDVLGDTAEKIAQEKSGIIKKGTTAISYPLSDGIIFPSQNEAAIKVIKNRCNAENVPLIVPVGDDVTVLSCNADSTVFTYKGKKIETPLWGRHQIGNLICCLCAVDVLNEKGYSISEYATKKAISHLQMPARTEKVHSHPIVILDGGHNENAAYALKNSIETYLKDKKVTLVTAFMKDKDYRTSLKIIAPLCTKLILTVSDTVRGESTAVLRQAASEYCDEIYECENGIESIKKALAITENDGAVLVCGSFYLASEIRNFFL